MIDAKYFKEYRNKLGFSSKDKTKKFFGAKDISPSVDYTYIKELNFRLEEIIRKIDELVHKDTSLNNINEFIQKKILDVFIKLKDNKIIEVLNNQGRRPEEVYFSWMRGYIVSQYFLKALSIIFNIDIEKISLIGDDDLENLELFKRTPKADLEIKLEHNKKVRIEVQSGFQGINDIKQHKVLEAKRVYVDNGTISFVMHFDIFNGQVAFVKLDDIEESDINWITRQQMEGQTVFNIDQNYFFWKLTEKPEKIDLGSFFEDN
jgi:uncharacterized protein (DUF488 family)